MADMAIIAGAGPAGLSAALELLEKTDVIPLVFEAESMVGGLSKTVNYKGNRLDIGGHRFFSKSTRVMDWWTAILPVQGGRESDPGWLEGVAAAGPDPDEVELVMLLRERRSRILYLRRMFDYPVSLNANTVRNLGPWRMAKIAVSYARARALPIRDERTLDQFMINRFGRELYRTFFEDYTEKVWGVPCSKIKADWGAQRIKGLSVSKVLRHALGRIFSRGRSDGDIYQQGSETSLIERFLYPKRGRDADGNERRVTGEYFISTMPVRDLISAIGDAVPAEVRDVAEHLEYRDFITVGVLLRRREGSRLQGMSDNWIYVQEPDVKVGRLQIFNNWSPYLVGNPDTLWLGMEYFDVIRAYVDRLTNLFLIGRNGMHRYNNQDHSILTAFAAVENIANGIGSKHNIWDVNVEREYHETKTAEDEARPQESAVSDA